MSLFVVDFNLIAQRVENTHTCVIYVFRKTSYLANMHVPFEWCRMSITLVIVMLHQFWTRLCHDEMSVRNFCTPVFSPRPLMAFLELSNTISYNSIATDIHPQRYKSIWIRFCHSIYNMLSNHQKVCAYDNTKSTDITLAILSVY